MNVTTEATFSGGDGFPRAQPRRGPESAFHQGRGLFGVRSRFGGCHLFSGTFSPGYNKTSPVLPGRLSRIELDSPGSSRLPTATEIATTEYVVADPALAAVVEAWPDLPETLKAGIVAMVKAAKSTLPS